MGERETIQRNLRELAELLEVVGQTLTADIEALTADVAEVLEGGGKLLFCGNGGSAADAQHLAAEYVVRFSRDRGAIAALALTTDSSVLTAAGNDLGFREVFARQVEALGRAGDLLVLYSTSGESENLVRAAVTARGKGIRTVAFLAKGGGPLASMVDRAIILPTSSTPRAQEVHLALGHVLCELVEDRMVGGSE